MTEETPIQYRAALQRLRKDFFKVEASMYREGEGLYIRLFRDKETVNPSYYLVKQHKGILVREDQSNRYHWPIYKSQQRVVAAPASTKRALRRHTVRRFEVKSQERPLELQRLFVERVEVSEDLREADLAFIRDPVPGTWSYLIELRKQMTQIESEIVKYEAVRRATA